MKRPCTRSTPQHFNPRSPDGERPLRRPVCRIHAKFQSTLPGWGVTAPCRATVPAPSNFNPRSPDGERQGDMRLYTCRVYISIHAPRMGSDTVHATPTHGTTDFNPRSPDGERPTSARTTGSICNFNPRSPDGERRRHMAANQQSLYFNPRSPDGERLGAWESEYGRDIFQSTLPGWGATGFRSCEHFPADISIHAPRMGSDRAQSERHEPDSDFNPRSPDRERQI